MKHPPLRLALVSLGAMAAIAIAEWHFHGVAVNYQAFNQLRTVIEEVAQDTRKLLSMYSNNPKVEIAARPDDPVIPCTPPNLEMVIFSDFQCPHCKEFAQYLQKSLIPLFQGHLRVTFKHFPGSRQCNKDLASDIHPHACVAAAAAEAARTLLGNDGFWKTHDILFANQDKLGKEDFYREVAGQLGLNFDTFWSMMTSQTIADRLLQDIAAARSIDVTSTPAVFVSNRRVPRIAVQQAQFWNAAKSQFDAIVAASRAQSQPTTQAATAPATEPSGGPRSEP